MVFKSEIDAFVQKKTSDPKARGFFLAMSFHQPQEPPPQEPQEPLLLPPSGILEDIEKPERGPASTKSTLMLPQLVSKPPSTRNFRSSWSKTLSESFGSSRANPNEGPDQPPCIRAILIAELILFCSRYDFKLFTARSVTSNIM